MTIRRRTSEVSQFGRSQEGPPLRLVGGVSRRLGPLPRLCRRKAFRKELSSPGLASGSLTVERRRPDYWLEDRCGVRCYMLRVLLVVAFVIGASYCHDHSSHAKTIDMNFLGNLGTFIGGAGQLAAGAGFGSGGGNSNRNTTFNQWMLDEQLRGMHASRAYTQQGIKTQRYARDLSERQHKQALKTRNMYYDLDKRGFKEAVKTRDIQADLAERKFTKEIQTRVADAKAAGVHPLFALGGGVSGSSPVWGYSGGGGGFSGGSVPSGGAGGGASVSGPPGGSGVRGNMAQIAQGVREMLDAVDPESRRIKSAQARLLESEAALNEMRFMSNRDGGDPLSTVSPAKMGTVPGNPQGKESVVPTRSLAKQVMGSSGSIVIEDAEDVVAGAVAGVIRDAVRQNWHRAEMKRLKEAKALRRKWHRKEMKALEKAKRRRGLKKAWRGIW